MTQIAQFQVIEQIFEEIEIDSVGRGTASIRATARLAGVTDMALRACV